MWTDEGIGSCTRCGTERRLFSADGEAALCSVCTIDDSKTRIARWLVGGESTSAPSTPRMRRVRETRLGLGLCIECDLPRVPNGVRCEQHRELNRQRARELYRRSRKTGNCVDCCKVAEAGKSQCRNCRLLARNRQRARKEAA